MLDIKKSIRISKELNRDIQNFTKKLHLSEPDAIRHLLANGLNNQKQIDVMEAFQNSILGALLDVKKNTLEHKNGFDIFSERFAKWAGTNGAMINALVRSNQDGAEEMFKEIIKSDGESDGE